MNFEETSDTNPQQLTLADVAAWLRMHNYGTTALELYGEVERCTGERYAPVMDAAERSQRTLAQRSVASGASTSSSSSPYASSSNNPSSTVADASLSEALSTCVTAFIDIHGHGAFDKLLFDKGLVDDIARGTLTEAAATDMLVSASREDVLREKDQELAAWTHRAQAAERQLKQLTVEVSDSLATLITAIDPMKKDALLPLLRSVAVLSETSTARAAARHAMLNLFKRPTEENRSAIVTEWVKVTRGCPRRAVELEIIPELYGLVNARSSERRQLALDCAGAVAAQIQDSYRVRYSLCQGLLRPLSEDESAAVRRAVPACLAALWGGDDPRPVPYSPPALPRHVHPHHPVSEPMSSTATVGSSSDMTAQHNAPLSCQSTFPMELGVRLALDAYSTAVRQATQAQLRDVIYPRCVADGSLLSTFVPLLMTFISMELSPLRPDDNVPGVSNTPLEFSESSFGTTAARPLTAGVRGNPARSTNPLTLAYSNLVTLVRLCSDAVQCAKGHLVRLEAAGPTSGFDAAANKACDAYLRVVLPTAYSLLPALLQAFSSGPAARRIVSGPLCGMGAALAALIPALNAPSWERIRDYLTASASSPESASAAGAVVSAATASAELTGRLLFLYVILICLSGEQCVFQDTQSAARDAGCSTPPAALCDRIGQESAELVARSLVTKTGAIDTDERMRLLAFCLGQLGMLSAGHSDRIAAGVTAVLWTFAESAAVTQRLHAIHLATQISAQPIGDSVKLSFVSPPLLVLLNDADATVREMAVKGLVNVAATMSQPAAQEKVLRPALATVEATGCISDITVVALHHWEAILGTMPAEPRETFLYPQLNILMDQLSDQQARRVFALQQGGRPGDAAEPQQQHQQQLQLDQRRWEKAMTALQSLLAAILRCAVVTPPLVAKYLYPGIHHLASDGIMGSLPSSSQLRARWPRLEQSYEAFIVSNSTFAAAQQATNLISRVRDELKRHF